MQTAGCPCRKCGHSILFDGDATWCGRCKASYHTACVDSAEFQCLQCRQPFLAANTLFVFSKSCPECFAENGPPQETCRKCGALTRWDTAEEYAAFQEHAQKTARDVLVRGLLELGAAALCLVAAVAGVWTGLFRVVSAAVLGIILLGSDGIYRILRSNEIRRWR